VYIATPNSLHKEHTLLCLDAGKAVLCEKPFALNAAEARAMVAAAREHRLFLMEAMWTRFIPLTVHLRELLAENALGEVRMLTADFGFRGDFEPEGILWNRAYGGGSLLDVGVYPVSFASMLFGKPSRIATMAHLGKTGVDELAGIVFGYEGGRMAVLHSAIAVETPQEATVMGDTAYARIGRPFWSPLKMTLVYPDERKRMVERPFLGSGYQFEVEEVMACLRADRTESALMPLNETIEIMESMDAIRAEWGLSSPDLPL
jgi:predicted dehydrogenase